MRTSAHPGLRATLLFAVLALGPLAPSTGQAQEKRIVPALVGGALGLGVGGYVSIGIWSWKAHQGSYLFTVDDALGWESTPILVGAATGAAIGWISQDRLRNAAWVGIGTGLVGTVVGAVVGINVWEPPEGRWAGGVLGGGAGLLLGAAVGMVLPVDGDDGDDGDEGIPVGIRIPVGFLP